MTIEEVWITGDAAVGGDGAAGVTTKTKQVVVGRILAVGVVYLDSPPASTDVTVRTANQNRSLPDVSILTLTNASTTVWKQPRRQVEDLTGAGVTYDGTNEVYEPVVIADQVEVVVAEANAGDSVDVCLVVER